MDKIDGQMMKDDCLNAQEDLMITMSMLTGWIV